MASKKIALIGGAGFIGHNLALELAQKNHEVHVLDGLQVNNLLYFADTAHNIPNRDLYMRIVTERLNMLREAKIPIIVQDARDYMKLSAELGRIKPDVVVLLAAVSHADRSNKDPHSTFDHSLRTLENALDYSRGTVEHFVYFSSSMVYGNFPSGFVTEETPCNPKGIYGALKFAGEKIVESYNQVFGLNYTIVRPSALYGERCVSRRVGQIFIENALQGAEITINGTGDDKLDFTYIKDLVQGVTCVIENKESHNQIFNITYGEGRSIAQMANILNEHFPSAKIKYLPKDALMPDRGTLAVDKAKQLIGYNPQYPLEKGFVKYIDWYKSTFK